MKINHHPEFLLNEVNQEMKKGCLYVNLYYIFPVYINKS